MVEIEVGIARDEQGVWDEEKWIWERLRETPGLWVTGGRIDEGGLGGMGWGWHRSWRKAGEAGRQGRRESVTA